MDQGHEDKRPRLGWPAGPSHHHGLPHPGQPLTTPSHHTQPLPPLSSAQYSPSPHLSHPPHPFSRTQEYPQQHQPPAPPPPSQHFDERRQHEPERFPPPPDQRHHPPPSPAHQRHYSPAGYQPSGRDSLVKRESDEIKLPQIVRPNSTSNGPEQTPLPPPPAHGPPQAHMEDQRRHMPYDNGPAPQQMYRQATYPPPTPISHPGPAQSPYEQTQLYAPPMGQDGSYPMVYPNTGNKRKSQRASQACDNCRQLKAKCDENKPCKNCLDKNHVCNYRDPAPKQQDKATQDILDAMQKMLQTSRREIISEVVGLLKTEIQDLKSDNRTGSAHSSRGPVSNGSNGSLHRPQSPMQIADLAESVASSPGAPSRSVVPDPEKPDPLEAAKTLRRLDSEEETEEPPGEPIRPQEAPFPHDHTTPAGRLLKWPSIRDMVRPLLLAEGIKWIDNYPQRFEESRGQLPLFGRGEASVTRPAERDSNNSEYVDIADDTSQVGDHQSPSAVTDWGPIGGMSPPGGGLPNDIRAHASRTDVILDFEDSKVWRYVESYKENIQNMHPLIPKRDLDAMVVSFLEEVGAQKAKTQAKFAEGSYLDSDRKRKRSPGPNGVEPGPPPKKQKPQRSIKHALVLLILALGKICLVKDRKIPEAPEKNRDYIPNNGSPVVRNGQITSPTNGSPPSSAISQSPGQALPSPKDMDRSAASRRSSVQANGSHGPTSAASQALPRKNYEVIPGLDYFAYATDILGNQFGGYKLNHVQAHILASLYYGQLGRVVPSFRHIRFACQVIVDKLQPAMERLNRYSRLSIRVTNIRDNKYLMAFWSCCQLESDILAELNLIPSGILQYEGLLPYPDMEFLHTELDFPQRIMNSFGAQLFLRKRMNEISGQLYNPKHNLNLEARIDVTRNFQNTLDQQEAWANRFSFDTNEAPAKDILSARFRAKFWGAHVINYRPYVEDIMGWSHARMHPEEYRDKAYTSLSVPTDATTPSDIPEHVIQLAERGIRAIIKSTEAFHGLKEKRFIITNVFGTAHAQWGNLITLAAAYQDPFLGPMIDETHLRHLFKKTIEFFETVAQDSSSLAIDLRILQGLLHVLPRQDQLIPIYRSGNGFPFRPTMQSLNDHQPYMSNGPTPRASGPSTHTSTNTPSDTHMEMC